MITSVFSFRSKRPTEAVILEAQNLAVGYDRRCKNTSILRCAVMKKSASSDQRHRENDIDQNRHGPPQALFREDPVHKPQKIGYFDQNLAGLTAKLTVLSTIHDRYPQMTSGKSVRFWPGYCSWTTMSPNSSKYFPEAKKYDWPSAFDDGRTGIIDFGRTDQPSSI
jgi:hypothetical protein